MCVCVCMYMCASFYLLGLSSGLDAGLFGCGGQGQLDLGMDEAPRDHPGKFGCEDSGRRL